MERFFDFVELKTKITSVFPFFMTAAFLFVRRQPIHWIATSVFFFSMISFDLATTAINNYIDSRHNAQGLRYKRGTAKAIIFLLLAFSVLNGIYLVVLTDAVVLIGGLFCFGCGILYTYGPVPISRTPFGEILSGIFYGIMIPFLLLYINSPTGAYLSLSLGSGTIDLSVNIRGMIHLGLFCAIPAFTTANIMLANNICDVQQDILVKRYTLPYYLGSSSLQLFAGLYYLCYVDVILMVLLRILSPVCLVFLLTWKAVRNNIKVFLQKQDKQHTFIVSIRNYIIINGAMTVLISISGFTGGSA